MTDDSDPGVLSARLRVADVVPETAEAISIVFEVPPGLAGAYAFRPGQFLTLGVPSERTGLVPRCYSLCVPPGEPPTVTVKRTADGYASGWLHDHLRPGDRLRVLPPEGIFSPRSLDGDLLLWAGGSGITPVMSILRAVLEQGTGRAVLVYANRDADTVIFADRLGDLEQRYPDRFRLVHWLESERGLPSTEDLRELARPLVGQGYESFSCGPAPFIAAVQAGLRELGVPRARRHQERFVSLTGNPFGDVPELRALPGSRGAPEQHGEA